MLGTFGEIEIAHAESATVKTASGDASVGRVTGDIKINSASGDARVGESTGKANFAAASGDVHMDVSSGAVNASTASGDITIERFTGNPTRSRRHAHVRPAEASEARIGHTRQRASNDHQGQTGIR